jgi:hypothetical protein
LSTRRMRIRSLRSPLAMMRWMSGGSGVSIGSS